MIAIAHELAELTGESPSRLHQWAKKLGLPIPRARQTFYTRIKKDLNNKEWVRKCETCSTSECRMGSYPMACELRIRVVSLLTGFRRDAQSDSRCQLIIVLGYEVCSSLLHFRIYRGQFYEESSHSFPLNHQIPVHVVGDFVSEMAKMVGLPLQRVLLTQRLTDFPELAKNEGACLSLNERRFVVRERNDALEDNELPCFLAGAAFRSKGGFDTLEGDHPFVLECRNTNATALTERLSSMVNRHNRLHAEGRIKSARKAFAVLRDQSLERQQERYGPTRWALSAPPFIRRVERYRYLDDVYLPRDVGFFRRQYVMIPYSETSGPFAER